MYELFKGYVPTKNKECLKPFKNKTSAELDTLEQVRGLPEYAAILNDDTILIDVDDAEMSERLYNAVEAALPHCRVYQTTRGKHFLFRNRDRVQKNATGAILACGIKADIKLGKRTSYSVLKYAGKDREIIYEYGDGEYDDVPAWLLPVKTRRKFWEMEKGDGRNQELYNYILTLQSAGFSKEDARQTIGIINKYVLKEPLEEKELEVILRDESFKKPIFFEDKTFLFDKFARYLQSEYNIIKINDQLHIYQDGVYVPGGIEAAMIKEIPALNRQKRSEVLAYLDILIQDNKIPASANYIAFANGIYNVETGELEDFDSSKIITNKINHNVVPGAYYEAADKALNKLANGDKTVRRLLEEVIGYTFYRRNELRKCFLLKGKKSNGKSTYMDMIGTLLGDHNTSALDLKELGDRFRTANVYGKLCNLGDDIDDEYISNTSIFKKLVSGDPVTCERKGQNPFEFRAYAKFIFSGNSIPRMGRGRDSAAIIDRIVIIPLDATFSADDADFDPYIKYKLRSEECMEYLIQIGIEGLKRVLTARAFSTNEKIQEEITEFEESNNPMLLFFQEVGDSIINEPTRKAYSLYDEFCIDNSIQKCSHIEFSKQVKTFYNCDIKQMRVNGQVTRVFVRKESEDG